MDVPGLADPEWLLDHVIVPAGPGHTPVGPVRAWQADWAARIRDAAERADAETAEPDGTAVGAATRFALSHGGVLTTADAQACGMARATWRRLIRRGQWVACGYGCASVLPPHDETGSYAARWAHTQRTAAAVHKRQYHAAAATSAAVVHGLPVLELPVVPQLCTDRHVTRGCLHAAQVRRARLRADELDDWFGLPVTGVARTVVDLARFDPRSGLMAADAALHEGLLTTAQLADAVRCSAGLVGARRAREVLALASPLIESPLESLTHLALHDTRFPAPRLQFRVRGGDGRVYRTDFAWPELGVALEADGKDKYRHDELWAEKRRELALARAGFRVVRVRWADVVHEWPATAAWLREALAAHPRAPRRPVRAALGCTP